MRFRTERMLLTLTTTFLVCMISCVPQEIQGAGEIENVPDSGSNMGEENQFLPSTNDSKETLNAKEPSAMVPAQESAVEPVPTVTEEPPDRRLANSSIIEHKGKKSSWEQLRATITQEISGYQKKIQELNLKLQLIDQIATRLELTTRAQFRKGQNILAEFTIENPTTYSLKDISITCDQIAPTGTKIQSHAETIYEILSPTSTRTFEGIELGRTHPQIRSLACEIKNFTVHKP